MNGKKARAIRKEHNVKHARLATIRVVREAPKERKRFNKFLSGPLLTWGRSGQKPGQVLAEPRHNSRTRRKLRSQRGSS